MDKKGILKHYSVRDKKIVRKAKTKEEADLYLSPGIKRKAKKTKHRSHGIIVETDPSEDKKGFSDWIASECGFLENFTESYNDEGFLQDTRFYHYQKDYLNSPARFWWEDKSRQVGESFVFASRAFARSMLRDNYLCIFTSFNEEEAKEKIRYASQLYHSMPRKYQLARPLVVDNKTSLEFDVNGKTTTRLFSHPQRPLRGKGRGDVVLDELGHYIYSTTVYDSAVPVTSRGKGCLTVGSTPLGKMGRFYEIGANEIDELTGKPKFPEYVRRSIPWWLSPVFCKDVLNAIKLAPKMETDLRCETFGTEDLLIQRRGLTLDIFQQEFECAYLDESVSFFPYDLINLCMPVDKEGVGLYHKYQSLHEIMKGISKKKIIGQLFAGWDVGRKNDLAEFYIIEEYPETKQQSTLFNRTFKNEKFQVQKEFAREALNTLPILRLGIDATGMGLPLAEDMEADFHSRIEPIVFTAQWKEMSATNFKIRMQSEKLGMYLDKNLKQQIHSVKRKVTASGNVRYDVDENEKHHADKFWALVLASEMGSQINPVFDLSKSQKFMDSEVDIERRFKEKEARTFVDSDFSITSSPFSLSVS